MPADRRTNRVPEDLFTLIRLDSNRCVFDEWWQMRLERYRSTNKQRYCSSPVTPGFSSIPGMFSSPRTAFPSLTRVMVAIRSNSLPNQKPIAKCGLNVSNHAGRRRNVRPSIHDRCRSLCISVTIVSSRSKKNWNRNIFISLKSTKANRSRNTNISNKWKNCPRKFENYAVKWVKSRWPLNDVSFSRL